LPGGGHLFERFTDRARRVVVLAQEEARTLNHNYVGTEHILLGLIHEGEGVAARALESLNISLEAVRQQVEELIGRGHAAPTDHPPFTPGAKKALEAASRQAEEIIFGGHAPPAGHIPFTPRAKKVLELSLREALNLGHNFIGTEHILLGLIREGQGVAAQVLQTLGADLNRVRQAVILLLSGYTAGRGEQVAGPQELETPLIPPSPFDEREKVVLSLLLQGTTISGIATVLGVSKEKVDEIIRAIVARLGEILQEEDG
jgi:ATP-dependent Clp protease ATP-binding subunit ClpC